MPKKNLINFNNVFLRYSVEKEVLKDINLSMNTGDFIFLIGESGAGKSSLLNMINLSLKPTRGQLEVLGFNALNIEDNNIAIVRRRIGSIFQNFKLIDNLSIFENIELPLKIIHTPREIRLAQVNELLKWINLYPYAHMHPKELSGGQQQLVAIARSVITRPDIILADEPTGSIDNKMAEKIMSLLVELNKQGVAIVFATHNISLLNQYTYPVAKLDKQTLQLV